MMSFWPFKRGNEKRRLVAKSIANAGFNVGDFQSYIKNGFFKIGNQHAYQLYDCAAPLSAAVDRISSGISQLDPMVLDQEGKTIENHPVLNILKRPGFGQSWQTIAKTVSVAYLLTGDAYFITDLNRKTLRTAKPFNVFIQQNSDDGFANSYRVSIQGTGRQSEFSRIEGFKFVDPTRNELVHIISETEDDGINGRSILPSIFTDIGQRIEGGKHNLSLLKNGMRSSMAFMFPEGTSEDQMDYFKEQLAENKSGPENAGTSLIVPWSGEVKELSVNNKDMDYKNVIDLATKTIALAYKVPLPLVVSEKQTLDNFSQATLALYDDAVFPLAEIIFDRLTELMGLENEEKISFDKSEVPAVRMRRFKEAELKNKSGKFSVDEIRQEFGGVAIGGEDGDKILVPINLVPLGEEQDEPPVVMASEEE